MDEFVNVSHVFINDISTYIATFCELNKRAKSSFIFYCFLPFHCRRLALDLKTEVCFKYKG